MLRFTATLYQFEEQGEKSGWTYLEIPADMAEELYPSNKKTFRVKGKLDQYAIQSVAVLPMGDGSFIIPFNAAMRKGTGKKKGALVKVALLRDDTPLTIIPELLDCLNDAPEAERHFYSLAPSRQRYFSKWIDEAKTETTKINRLALCVAALSRQMDFGAMIREQKKIRKG